MYVYFYTIAWKVEEHFFLYLSNIRINYGNQVENSFASFALSILQANSMTVQGCLDTMTKYSLYFNLLIERKKKNTISKPTSHSEEYI